MKRAIAILLLVLGVGVALWMAWQRGWLFGSWGGRFGGEDAAGTAAGADAAGLSAPQSPPVALGRLEPAGKVIDVGALAGDRLASLNVSQGDTVEQGATLAILDSRALRQLDVESIKSQLAEAQDRYTAEENLAEAKITCAELALRKAKSQQPDIDAQQQKVLLLEANLKQAQREAARLANLPGDLASPQERERQALAVQQADSNLASARAVLERLTLSAELDLEAAKADLAAAHANREHVLKAIPVKSLGVGCKLAQAQLDRTEIKAPCAGTILRIFTRPGELIGSGPILQLADLTRMAVVAEVHESNVKWIHLGQKARISSKALRSPYDREGLRGTVAYVGKMVSAPGLKPVDPFAPADRHVVEVRIELDEEGSRQSASLTNLQVDVTFLSD